MSSETETKKESSEKRREQSTTQALDVKSLKQKAGYDQHTSPFRPDTAPLSLLKNV